MPTNQTSSKSFGVTIGLAALVLSSCGEQAHTHDTSSDHHNQGQFGEPGSLSFVTTADTSFVFSEAFAAGVTIAIAHCDGTDDSVTSTGAVDMISQNTTDIPPGGVCLFVIELHDLKLTGDWASGSGFTFAATSITTELWATMPFYSDDTHFLFELGGDNWPTAAEMFVSDGVNETLQPDSESYQILVEAIELGSLIYRDVDGDGLLSDSDLEKSPVGIAVTSNGDTGE